MSGNSTSHVSFEVVNVNDSVAYLFIKRLMDIVGATLGIICLSPIFVLIALLIKLDDFQGPVLFSQIRVGKNGRDFKMYKFRSMVSNAEELKEKLMIKNEATGPVFKMREDPRITKIGKFIRRTSIDELPQLINVLKGEMSLVGPRPPLPLEVDLYNSYQKQRLQVTPGLTCYWQVSGRSNLSFSEWIELDLKYINNRDILLDIKLIFKTIFVLFGSKDAF
ncbi:sugar transferase [Halobacillus ihumii]|uniref:sugar transferase n=1 Tax=Halobacillus ihumii TaxID=2686092 RepID=UPI0019686A02|nr:sugar transferase [Halobacillus ihumii]